MKTSKKKKANPALYTYVDIHEGIRLVSPDEDSDFSIRVNRTWECFSIDQAKEIIKYLKEHIKNIEKT